MPQPQQSIHDPSLLTGPGAGIKAKFDVGKAHYHSSPIHQDQVGRKLQVCTNHGVPVAQNSDHASPTPGGQ